MDNNSVFVWYGCLCFGFVCVSRYDCKWKGLIKLRLLAKVVALVIVGFVFLCIPLGMLLFVVQVKENFDVIFWICMLVLLGVLIKSTL